MSDIITSLTTALASQPYRIVLSGPLDQAPYRKIILHQRKAGFQAEQYTATQVFHQQVPSDEILRFLHESLGTAYLQCHLWNAQHVYSIRITKKGKALFSRQKNDTPPKPQATHNRQKQYLLPEGTVVPPLVDLGILTPEGKVVAAMQEKYRQINRMLEMIDDVVRRWPLPNLRVVDFGCGKSYLTFIVYYYLTVVLGLDVQMRGMDLKADVIQQCRETATKYRYDGLQFQVGNIANAPQEEAYDMMLTLHACDTATDHALAYAVNNQVKYIFSVPCCQHELNQQIRGDSLKLVTRYGIIQERASALMTDAIRANLLEYAGYKTQVLEFVDFADTPKNLLLRAVKRDHTPEKHRQTVRNEVDALCKTFQLEPTLRKLLPY